VTNAAAESDGSGILVAEDCATVSVERISAFASMNFVIHSTAPSQSAEPPENGFASAKSQTTARACLENAPFIVRRLASHRDMDVSCDTP